MSRFYGSLCICIGLSYGIRMGAELSFILSQCTRLLNRLTDGRTNEQTLRSPLPHCIQCRAVKTTERIFGKSSPQMHMDKENCLNFGSYPDTDTGIFKDFSTLRVRAFFHNLAHISGKTDRIFMLEVIRIRTPDTDSIRIRLQH